jgi:hypothetical protein
MNFFKLESTKFTPGVVLDPSTAVLELYGFSLPENALEFYQPIIEWLRDYKVELLKSSNPPEVNALFKLVYFNSSSLRLIVEVFQVLSEMHHGGIKVNLSWHYDSEDIQMAESGREMGEVTKIPVNIVPIY